MGHEIGRCSMTTEHRILQGDVLERLRILPDTSVDVTMTSPPYWGLRVYVPSDHPDKVLEIGLEDTPGKWLARLWSVFDEVWRVTRDTGTCWVNLGDTYGGGGKGHSSTNNKGNIHSMNLPSAKGLDKSLVGTPEMFMLGMIYPDLRPALSRGEAEAGAHPWLLRNHLVWHKPNSMPCSAKDRLKTSWEYLYFFAKRQGYWFDLDAVRKPFGDNSRNKPGTGGTRPGEESNLAKWAKQPTTAGANPGDVLSIPSQPRKESHFAAYPDRLVEFVLKCAAPKQVCPRCGKGRGRITKPEYRQERTPQFRKQSEDYKDAKVGYRPKEILSNLPETLGWTDCGCGEGWTSGVLLDPFAGRGTCAVVAKRLGRSSISIELNPEYCRMIEDNLAKEPERLLPA